MGQYSSIFITPAAKAVTKTNGTHPNKANWITAHAIASELSIAEVERLWVRFQQIGCNKDGELTEQTITKSPYNQDIFVKNILKKYMEGNTKKITFENFLRALKWAEQATVEEKIRAIYHFISNGAPITKDLMIKVYERVYPQDKGDPVRQIVDLMFQFMDQDGKGALDEEMFYRGIKKLPKEYLDECLYFQILPEDMKTRLHKNLQEFRSESQRGRDTQRTMGAGSWGSGGGGGGGAQTGRNAQKVPPDEALREVANKIFRKDWLRVANRLGFFAQDIEEIQQAYPNNVQQQVLQMLRAWKDRDGEEAFSDVLEQALVDCNMADAAIVLTSY